MYKVNEMKPHNIEAEEAVLGSLLIDPDAILFVINILRPQDFFIKRNEWVYQSILDLHTDNKPADILAIGDLLKKDNRDVEAYYLTGLINSTPSSLHAVHYAELIKEASIKRQLIDAAGTIAKVSYNGATAEAALSESMAAIMGVSIDNITHKPRLAKEYTGDLLDSVTEMAEGNRKPGIATNLMDFDKLIGGYKAGKMYIIAGRPGMGKSALALQSAIEAAKIGNEVLYFSLEMPGIELVTRMVSSESGIDSRDIENGTLTSEQWTAFYKALQTVESWPIYIDDKTRHIEGIRAKTVLQSARGVDLLIVDYIQRAQTKVNYQNRDSEVGAVGSELKSIALDLNIPIIAISSLNRQCENRQDKRPMLADLRESGNLEYDADCVVFLYRDEIYYPNTEFPNLAELKIAKQRGGGLGVVTLYFKKICTKFIDLQVRSVNLNE